MPEGTATNSFRHIKNRKKRAFLLAYAKIGIVRPAAVAANIDRSMHYAWLKRDPEYIAAFAAAEQEANDRTEEEIWRRAVQGVEKDDIRLVGVVEQEMVDDRGKPVKKKVNCYEKVGTIREFSDTLLLARANAHLPNYGRYRHEVSGPAGGAIPLALFDAIAEETEKTGNNTNV